MRYRVSELLISFMVTVFLLTVLEIFSTAFVPALGLSHIMIPFNILLILFIAFRVQTPYVPLIVLGIQVFHSVFTVEGWAHGTLTGVLTCVLINYLKDIVELKTSGMTILVTFFASIFWFLLSGIFYFISVRNLDIVIDRFIGSIPECLILALLAPFFFIILDKIWRVDAHRVMEA